MAGVALFAAACGSGSPTPDAGTDAGTGCQSNADCDGGVCAAVDGGRAMCLGCATNGDCRPQQLCGAGHSCVFRTGWGDQCTSNSDCAAAQLCDQGLCVASGAATLCQRNHCPTGQRCNVQNQVCEEDLGCTGDGECLASQVCNPGTLLCVPRCDPADAGAVCDPNQKCVNARCVDCTASADCGPGLTCDSASGTCTAPGICFTDSSCPAGTVCNSATNTCVAMVAPCTSNDGCGLDQVCDAVSGRCVPNTCQPDQFDPNQTMATAAPIAVGIQYSNLTLCGPSDVDWFSVPLLSGDLLQVTVSTDVIGSGYSFGIQFVDDAGAILASGDNLALNGVAPAEGTYYLAMTDGDPTCVYGFSTLVSHGQPCPPNPLGTITSRGNAAFLDGGVGPIYLCAGQMDWFRLDTSSGGVSVTLGCDPTQGPLGLAAELPDGGVLSSSNDGSALQTVDVPATDAGPLYVVVSGAGQTNAYTLVLAPSKDGG